MVIIVGITGASGAIYGVRLLEVLAPLAHVETHLVVSQHGATTIAHETGRTLEDVARLADYVHDNRNIGATLASGSFQRDAMIIAPCTVKTLAALANAYAENLICRAADVNLKQRRPLVLLVREAPLHLGHLRNMAAVTEMGATVFPPSPTFYNKPQTIAELVDATVGRVLDLVGIEHQLSPRWSGLPLA